MNYEQELKKRSQRIRDDIRAHPGKYLMGEFGKRQQWEEEVEKQAKNSLGYSEKDIENMKRFLSPKLFEKLTGIKEVTEDEDIPF